MFPELTTKIPSVKARETVIKVVKTIIHKLKIMPTKLRCNINVANTPKTNIDVTKYQNLT